MAKRKGPKVTKNAGRKGQQKGQLSALATKHDVSQDWLRLVSEGALDDPAFVRAIRKAAKVPQLWDVVQPAARNALFLPTAKIEQLGGSLDDLLESLLHAIEVLRSAGGMRLPAKLICGKVWSG